MLDEALRHDLGHELVGIVDTLAPLKSQCVRERVGEVARVRGRRLACRNDLRHARPNG